jgi:hypothetical protein
MKEIQTTDLARAGTQALEAYIAAGDIGKLTAPQRIALYRAVCDSLGLNPLTQPFEYLALNGKLQLYAKKSATEQLRQIHGVSCLSLEQEIREGVLCMTVRVRDRSGREDLATGAVNLAGLKGEPLANAYMKCETKAKRRATLSICGLAMLDETEVDSIPGARAVPVEEVHTEPLPAARALPPAKVEPAAPAAEKPEPAAEGVEREVWTVPPDAAVSVVANSKGTKVWRIDIPGQAEPLAVLDRKIASRIEAESAFRQSVRVVAELRSGRWVGIRLAEEAANA